MKRILKFMYMLKEHKQIIFLHILLLTLISIVDLAIPEVLRRVTDAVSAKSAAALSQTGLLAVAAVLFYLIVTSIDKSLGNYVYNKCEETVQLKLIDKLLNLKKSRREAYSSGDVVAKIIQNSREAVRSSLQVTFSLIKGIITIIIVIIYMAFLNLYMAAAVVASFIISRFILQLFERQIKKRSDEMVKITKRNNTSLINIINNFFTIRVFGREKYFEEKIFHNERETLRINIKLFAWYDGLFESMLMLDNIVITIIAYALGGYLVYKGAIGFGVVVAYTLAMDYFSKGVRAFVDAMADKSTVIPNIESVEELFCEPICENEPEGIISAGFPIIFEDVSFGFGGKHILKNVSFVINQGERVALCGENGQGKSTLLKLLLGLYRPDSGKIYYGDADVTEINIKSMSEAYCYIPQDSQMLDSDLWDNIALSEPADMELCNDILDSLGLSHIRDYPASLSQGEKQRVNISRAIYKARSNDSISLILGDEIFSNIDVYNQDKTAEILNATFAGKTIIFVCHEDMPITFDRKLIVSETQVFEGGVPLA